MKNRVLLILTMVFFLAACNQKKSKQEDVKTESATKIEKYSCPMHPEVTGNKGEKCSKCGMVLSEPVNQDSNPVKSGTFKTTSTKTVGTAAQSSFSINEIVNNYLALKNALAKDDSRGAADAGKGLFTSFNTANLNSIDAKVKEEFIDIADDAKEHAEHIGGNSGKIDHQREHFAMLSKDINDLIKIFGTNQKLYQDYCPMYDQGKSGYWISETKEIKNPYYGSKMLSCGTVKKEW